MKLTVWLVLLALIVTPFGFMSFGILLKLGIEASLAKYGPELTIAMGVSMVSLLVAFGFLIDKRQGRL